MRELRVVWLTVLLQLGGCSFLFVSGPPEKVTAYTTLNCTTSRAAPGVDAALAALSGVGTIAEGAQGYPDEYIAAGALWSVVYATSAIYGFSVTNSCEEATEQRDQLVEALEREKRERDELRWRLMQEPPPQPRY